MAEELNRRSRLATALIAGPAVTVGLLGVGAAPALADEETEGTSVEETDGPQESEEGEGAGEGAEGSGGDEGGESDSAGGDASDDVNNSDSDGATEADDSSDVDEGTEESDDGGDSESEGDESSGEPSVGPQEDEGDEDPSDDGDASEEPSDPAAADEGLNATVTVEETEVEPGGQITVTGQDFPAGEEVEFRSNTVTIGTATADEDGNLYAEITIPEDFEPGGADLSAVFGDDEERVASSGFTVVEPQDDDEPGDDDGDDGDNGDDETNPPNEDDEADVEQEVTPNAPERYGNTVVIPETEGVTYEADFEPVEAGEEFELTEDAPSLNVTAVADEGFVLDEEAEVSWSFQWDPGFEDIWPVDPPEGWEADEDRWYSNVPETHLPDGYADWILDYANSANRNAEGSQEFEADTQVYLEPSMDADTIGDAFPPDGAVWWGYLEDEDFWMIVHQYTGAAGFLPGESHLGEEPPVDEEASISVDSSEVEAGDEITVTGEGFEAGEEIDFTLSGTSLGSTTADDDGNISTELTIPEDTEPGDYTLTAVGAQSGNGGSASLTVIDPDAEEPTAELTLDVDEVEAGGEVTATGEGFEPGEDVAFEINPELGTFSADDSGEVTAELTIPEDTEPGERTVTATGADSERVAEAALTVLEPEDDDDPEIDPSLTVDPEEIALEDFVGDPEEGAGVDHSVEGLEPGGEIEYVVTGPDGVDDFIGVGIADDDGNAEFFVHGFDVADPSVYLGEYTTVVAYEDEDGEVDELGATFTVVDGEGEPTPPEDGDGDGLPNLSDELQIGPNDVPAGSNAHCTIKEAPVVNAEGEAVGYVDEGAILAIVATDAAWPAAPIAGHELWVPDYDEYLLLLGDCDDPTAPGDEDHAGNEGKGGHEPSGDTPGDDELAQTGVSSTGVGVIAGLLLLVGGALAVFGYRGRFSRKA